MPLLDAFAAVIEKPLLYLGHVEVHLIINQFVFVQDAENETFDVVVPGRVIICHLDEMFECCTTFLFTSRLEVHYSLYEGWIYLLCSWHLVTFS